MNKFKKWAQFNRKLNDTSPKTLELFLNENQKNTCKQFEKKLSAFATGCLIYPPMANFYGHLWHVILMKVRSYPPQTTIRIYCFTLMVVLLQVQINMSSIHVVSRWTCVNASEAVCIYTFHFILVILKSKK